MLSLSDLPDEILNLISIRLNGFDNCSLWMASDSILKQRLVNNVITDFDIKYTIPGTYLWPGNFLKKLQKLSRLSLVAGYVVSHLPIQNVELFPIPTLKYLKFDFSTTSILFNENQLNSSNDPTGPTTSSSNKYINLNDYYGNLEHLEIINPWLDVHFSNDFLLCLPKKLKTLLIPHNYFKLDHEDPSNSLNTSLQILPTTLTTFNTCFEYPYFNKAYLDLSKLPANLTNLTTNAFLDDKTYQNIPKSLKTLVLLTTARDVDKLSPYLPTGLETLSIPIEETPSTLLSHLESLEQLTFQSRKEVQLDHLITKCPPKLQKFSCNNLVLRELPLPNRLFNNCLTTLALTSTHGVTSEFISSLPHTLTDLMLTRSSSDLDRRQFAYFSLLPRNLKSLLTNLSIVENTSLLPESLTSLRLNAYEPCDVSCFDRLPPKLETFAVSQNLPRSILKQLPVGLTHLYLNSSEVFDGDIIAKLPKGLLRLYLETPDEINDGDVADLPPSLEILLLAHNTKLTDDAIPFLPRSLMQLNVPQNPNFTDECIKHLPRKLTSLCLNQATKITSKSCKDLPEYLQMFSLPNCKDWNSDVLIASKNELPRFIKNINLGNPEATRTWKSILTDMNRD